jgi:hypothetical protein
MANKVKVIISRKEKYTMKSGRIISDFNFSRVRFSPYFFLRKNNLLILQISKFGLKLIKIFLLSFPVLIPPNMTIQITLKITTNVPTISFLVILVPTNILANIKLKMSATEPRGATH